MKSLLLCLLTLMAAGPLFAQQSWKALHNDKTVLSAKGENEEKNVITIKASDLKKKKNFALVVTEGEKKPGWERTIAAYSPEDAVLNTQQGTRFTLSNATLQSLFKKSSTIRIYTTALPTDPDLRARIRVRRVHLCTLVLK